MSIPKLVRGNWEMAKFIERVNRFVVKCYLRGTGDVYAFMANPGRLGELLLPGVDVVLERSERSVFRKTQFKACAVFRGKTLIGLDTHLSNEVARYLINNSLVPGLELAEITNSEVTMGSSRFDFLVQDRGVPYFVEVKSVSLSGNGIAMFPDAVTERGKRHVRELADLGNPNKSHVILFLAQGSGNDFFMPNYHTDLNFARTVFETKDRVRFIPIGISWDESLRLSGTVKLLSIPWEFIGDRMGDTGSYLLSLKVSMETQVRVGSLGLINLAPGYYLYVGSAMNGLTARVSRHMRLRKKMHWDVDYIRQVSDRLVAYRVRTPLSIECDLAEAVGDLFEPVIPGFGASDSALGTHLFFSKTDPSLLRQFQLILEKFRFIRPSK